MKEPELHWTEVDGVTTVWVQGPLPMAACLVFRTGRVDETLATSGRTHLIEHLAMWRFTDPLVNANGAVAGAHTSFTIAGDPAGISRFLSGVCGALTHLPGERLEAEKQVLLAEDAARPQNVTSSLLSARYGARGYGLLGIRELGFQAATLAQLQSFAEARFCRENAFLWLMGPPPAGLRLDLPSGEKRPLPRLEPVLRETPCWFAEDHGGIAVGAVVGRTPASSVFRVLCQRVLLRQLRTVRAISYAPAVSYDYLDAGTAHLSLFADSEQKNRADLAEAFVDVFEQLGEFSEPEVEEAKREITEHWTGALAPAADVMAVAVAQRAAMDWVCGREFESLDDIMAGVAGVDRGEVEAFGRHVQRNAVFALPREAKLRSSLGDLVPSSSADPVRGKKARLVDWPVYREHLVYGPDGVTLNRSDKSHSTIRYANLEAAVTNSDGRVSLVATDGAIVTVEPTLWRNGGQVCREINKRVPADLLLPQGQRSVEAIPKPSTTRWRRFRAFLNYRPEVAFALILVLLLGFAIGMSLSSGGGSAHPVQYIGPLVILLIAWTVRSLRRR